MAEPRLTRALVKQRIQDGDRVFLVDSGTYKPETKDHRQCWPKIALAIEMSKGRGTTYAALRAIGGSNKDYAAYLIGQLQVLRCPVLEQRLGLIDGS
jgi:hypothetical protein